MNIGFVRDSKLVRSAALVGAVVVLVLSLLFAELTLWRSELRFQTPAGQQSYMLPEAEVLSAFFLNYDNAAADVVWMRALIYFGEQRQRAQNPKHLEQYARTVATLDPYFYSIYQWFADIHITERHAHSEDAIEVANRFLELGMRYFPDDHRLPYTAGLNYIGYSTRASAERRLRESKRATQFLERAATIDGAPPTVIPLLEYFYSRQRRLERQLEGKDERRDRARPTLSKARLDLYARLYQLADREHVRRRIEQVLERHGGDSEALLEQIAVYARRAERQHARDLNYLPADLWTTLLDSEYTDGTADSP